MKIKFIQTLSMISFLVLLSTSLQAQIPKLISYQGLLTNSSGASLSNGTYDVTVKIFDAQSGGNELWSENHTVSLTNGFFSVALGSNNALNLAFDRAYYVSTTVDGAELLPRTVMTASPYALNAPSSGGTNGKAYALDAFDGSKIDVVAVDSDGRVSINTQSNPAIQLNLAGDPEAVVGMVITNNYTGGEISGIGVDVRATAHPTLGLGGRFTGRQTGLQGIGRGGESEPLSETIGVLGIARGVSDFEIGVKGTVNGLGEAAGVFGFGNSNAVANSGERNIGVLGEATAKGTFNIGVFGKSNSFDPGNWAGYFDGNTYIENNLSFGINNIPNPSNRGMLIDKFTGISFFNGITDANINLIGSGTLAMEAVENVRINTKLDVVVTELQTPLDFGLNLSGVNNGISIFAKTSTNADNFFILFNDPDGIQGAITGSTSFADLDLGGRLAGFLSGIFVPKSNAPTTAKFELFPAVDENWGSSTNTNKTNDINSADTDDFGTVLANFAGDRVNIEFLIEAILLSIDVAENAVAFASSFGSVLDPEDIFSTGLDLVISGVNLGVFLGYAIAADGVAYNSGAGDYAEWLIRADSSEMITFGDIVGLRAGEISTNFIEADHFMAISTAPAVVGATPNAERQHLYEKVAFMGQVPVKVRGVVTKGDYIVPSGDGDGLGIAVRPKDMLAKDYHRIVGIAWDESDGKEMFKMINTAVGINQNDLANIVDQMQTTMNQIQLALKEVNPDFEVNLFATNGTQNVQQVNDLGYTVSSSHNSKTAGLFGGQQFSNVEEAKVAIKDAWTQTAQLDLEQNGFLTYMLEHPEAAPAMIEHYTGAIEQLQNLAKQINAQLGSDD